MKTFRIIKTEIKQTEHFVDAIDWVLAEGIVASADVSCSPIPGKIISIDRSFEWDGNIAAEPEIESEWVVYADA